MPSFRLLTRKALRPSAEEIARNPRARSSRLRAALRSDAPIFQVPDMPSRGGRQSQGGRS